MRFRLISVFAVICATAGVLLLLSDAIGRDQALALGGIGFLAGSAVLGILLAPPVDKQGDVWTTIAWGKFFVAIVYISIAVACLVAMVHTPDAARFVHAVRAAL